jgi:osmotically-inducible protein OsmY
MASADVQSKLEQALEQVGIHAAVAVDEDIVTLAGEVDTDQARQAAEDIVRELAPDRRLDNSLEVQDTLPVDVEGFQAKDGSAENLSATREELDRGDSQIEPDFTDQPVTSAADYVVDDQDQSFFAPTDPVIEPGKWTNSDVVGGFSGTSLDAPRPERSASDGKIGDEALETSVRQMLISDASTTELNISVSVRDGVVILEGGVEGIEDAESAESVASSVPGVREVIDRIEVAG